LNRRLLLAAAALGTVAIGIGAYIGLESSRGQTLTTARGEQRSLVLADGSRVILDTATRLRLHFSRERRALELLTGQAHFDVAKDPARPFIVTAGDKQVIAVGTAFDVSRELGVTSVMLTEGKIVVRQDGAAHVLDQTLSPGDRLIFQPDTRVRQDRPNIAAATAWQTGQVVFDDVPLSEAVEHMNRYESKPIVIADPAVGSLHISGAYKSGNADAFVKSVSILLPVVATADGTQWVLTKDPRRR
jgi:transmembrane sensor